MHRRAYPLLISLVGLICLSIGLWVASVNIVEVRASWPGQEEKVDLPWWFDGTRHNNVLTIEFKHQALSPTVFHIIPDDQVFAISLNNQDVSLADIPAQQLRDYSKGFHLDLTSYLHPGNHHLSIRFHNHGGPGGIDIRPVWSTWYYVWIYVSMAFIMLGFAAIFRLRAIQKVLLVLALIPVIAYWSATPWLVRAHDVGWSGGHYYYIEHVATRHVLPKPSEGWVYYHPPAYYVTGAVVWKAAKLMGLQVHETLQLFSVFLWLIYLVASLATINQFLRRGGWSNFIASLGLALWPAGILHSPAIGNDAGLYAVAALATWLCCRWWYTGRRIHLLVLALLCGLALLTKSNGIALPAAVALLLLLRFALQRRRRWRAFMDGIYFGVIITASLAASMAVRVYYYVKGESASWLISNLGNLNSALRVPADIKAFIPLDIPTFLTQPFLGPFNSETGRDYFWNYLLRSSITGEYAFQDPFLIKLSYLMGLLVLLLFFAWVIGLPRIWRTSRLTLYRHLPLILLGVIWMASLIALRIKAPYASSNDFRYILPVLVPLMIFLATQGPRSRLLLVILSLTSAVFYTAVGWGLS